MVDSSVVNTAVLGHNSAAFREFNDECVYSIQHYGILCYSYTVLTDRIVLVLCTSQLGVVIKYVPVFHTRT